MLIGNCSISSPMRISVQKLLLVSVEAVKKASPRYDISSLQGIQIWRGNLYRWPVRVQTLWCYTCWICHSAWQQIGWSLQQTLDAEINKNLCGRDGRTICGPLCVPKSTYVTLAHNRKQKFFYFGCSLVKRFYCKINKNNNGTDGQTDRQTDRRTDRVRRNMRPPPREEGRIINNFN